MKEIPFSAVLTTDPKTKRRVWRICPAGQNGTHAYFTSPSFDLKGRLLTTIEIEGKVQLCRVDLRLGTCHQLTDLDGIVFQEFSVIPQRNGVLICRDRREIILIDIETGAHRVIFTAPDGYITIVPTADNSGRYLAFAVTEKIPVFTRSKAIYSDMEGIFYARPRCLILRLDLDTDAVEVVWGEQRWLTHVLINPVDPDTIVYCHEGGYMPDSRLWAVSARKSHKKQPRCLFPETRNHFLVHEFFCPDGVLGVQCAKWPDDHVEMPWGDPRSQHGVLFLDMDGGIVAEYMHPADRSMHVQSNADRSLIVADTLSVAWNQPHDEHSLSLLRPDAKKILQPEHLCDHGTSWKSQHSHPHPSFSLDEKYIAFTSDAGGSLSPYVVEI
ncbi:MAG: oligogalacturonate lyase family protein [Opitutaceae bacterium]|jgi:oligogalacturonide lyase